MFSAVLKIASYFYHKDVVTGGTDSASKNRNTYKGVGPKDNQPGKLVLKKPEKRVIVRTLNFKDVRNSSFKRSQVIAYWYDYNERKIHLELRNKKHFSLNYETTKIMRGDVSKLHKYF